MNEYSTKNTNAVKDIEIRIRDTIFCADGCRMIIRVDISLKTIQTNNPYKNSDTGTFNFSITKIRTDSRGIPKLFTKVEKEIDIDSKGIEFLANNRIIIKKEVFDEDTNQNYYFDMELEEYSRRSSKNMINDINDKRKIEEENETVTAFLVPKGNINGEKFSKDAEGSLTITFNKQDIAYKGSILFGE